MPHNPQSARSGFVMGRTIWEDRMTATWRRSGQAGLQNVDTTVDRVRVSIRYLWVAAVLSVHIKKERRGPVQRSDQLGRSWGPDGQETLSRGLVWVAVVWTGLKKRQLCFYFGRPTYPIGVTMLSIMKILTTLKMIKLIKMLNIFPMMAIITSTFDTVDYWACQMHFGQESKLESPQLEWFNLPCVSIMIWLCYIVSILLVGCFSRWFQLCWLRKWRGAGMGGEWGGGGGGW